MIIRAEIHRATPYTRSLRITADDGTSLAYMPNRMQPLGWSSATPREKALVDSFRRCISAAPAIAQGTQHFQSTGSKHLYFAGYVFADCLLTEAFGVKVPAPGVYVRRGDGAVISFAPFGAGVQDPNSEKEKRA